ncbi:hypothetical protein [Caenispirillum salinarum]|uniref:hypothetical protein n=1 Tax=Caenispirillum salinarum TaxID=859058 RepID=UPI00384FE605
MSERLFTKPHLSTPQHLDVLRGRGLRIPAPEMAAHYLNTVGYYRLSAHFKPFVDDTNSEASFQAPRSTTC